MEKKKFYEKGLSANRNLLAIIVITFTISAIVITSIFYYQTAKTPQTAEKIFLALIPLFATWVGTVLAFYFGKENFEIATNRYKQILDRLSPDILDDINVNQIMISKKTMVYKSIEDVKDDTVSNIVDFLNTVNKSRLPILEQGKIKYIIHKSIFLSALNKRKNDDRESLKFSEFIEKNKDISTSYLEFKEGVILEQIRSEIVKNSSIKDVFIINNDGQLIGWITDTLILRYLNTNKKPVANNR